MLETFDLSLLEGPSHEIWASALSRHGAVHGVPRTGANLPSLAELADITEDFEDAIQYARPFSTEDVGSALRDIVFGEPEIMALFHRGRGAAGDLGNQVLVRILAAPAILAKVPWELILDPEGGTHRHLTLAQDVHIVRAARSRTYPTRATLLEPPLNVLLILSSPIRSATDDDSMAFDLFEEKRNLLGELALLQESDILRIDVEEHPTLENLRRRIGSRRGGYHIVHYLGHAAPGQLFLENRLGRSEAIPAATFTDLLRLCPQLRLSLFAGCETARAPTLPEPAKEWREGLSTADQCVRDSCPTVIGMRAVLPFRTEWLFARFFYQGLASGYAITDAVRLARAAIRGDEFVGGKLLDWAVPCVIAGSDQLGPMIEPPKPAPRRRRLPRTELKFDLVEEDREFFSRMVQLRTAIDVLGGTSGARVLVVTGSGGVGKTSLVDRALQDLGDSIDCVLYFKATRLLGETDPVLRLALWVAEILTTFDQRERSPQKEWNGSGWWERLLGDLTGTRFVIVIDDLHLVSDPSVIDALAAALRQLADRRGNCRLALLAAEMPPGLVDASLAYVASLKLLPFAWEEIWMWIRRNLPVLTRFGKVGLADCYAAIGNDLAVWRDLAKSVSAVRGNPDLPKLVDEIVSQRPAAAPPAPPVVAAEAATALEAGAAFTPGTPGTPGAPGAPAVPAPPPAPISATSARTQRSLRVAVAGNHVKSPEDFARAMTQFAAQYEVGGRAVTAQQSAASRLAELLPIPPLFDAAGMASTGELLKWLQEIEAQKPDIVLMDFGSPEQDPSSQGLIERIAQTSLVIAAAGNIGRKGPVTYPARLEQVLAVGALGAGGDVASYSPLPKTGGKPELHAPESLSDSPLSIALDPQQGDGFGTSFAALRVAAAAALVWSINPGWELPWLRAALLNSASSRRVKGRAQPIRTLNIEGALELARTKVVLDAIDTGELSFPALQGAVGLSAGVLDSLVATLKDRTNIVAREEGGTEVYRLRDWA